MSSCPICGGANLEEAWHYDAPPVGEAPLLPSGEKYSRSWIRCESCGHLFAAHNYDFSSIYDGEYVAATYKADGMRKTFERVTGLPPERSDNVQRAFRIDRFMREYLGEPRSLDLLDVGSGTGVFPHRMMALGWSCTALDPDPTAIKHIHDVVQAETILGNFLEVESERHFTLVTFNKVLEHIEDPISALARTRIFLKPGGFVYVEVPDGEGAAKGGFDREEFFIEHYHCFSPASLCLLAERAGFEVVEWSKIVEPSSKFTLFCFLKLR